MTQIKVEIFYDHGRRSRALCHAMSVGISRCGDKVALRSVVEFNGKPQADVAVFYGLRGRLMKVYHTYQEHGRQTVLMDLGYWKRLDGGRLKGYHKFVVNGIQPNRYYQNFKHEPTRLQTMELDIKPHNPEGEYILVAGMSEKSAGVYGMGPQEFEEDVIQALLEDTNTPIVYRPKPSWPDYKPIQGTKLSKPEDKIEDVLKDCKVVITHHSNVAIDAVVAGKPCIVLGDGVGMEMSSTLADLDNLYFPTDEERLQWLQDISYLQWNVSEIRRGKPWQHFKKEELI